jgi:GTP-binding protein
MLDSVVLQLRGGTGGAGAVSFRREKFVPLGGPDGGDGGPGGHIHLRSVDDVYTLEQYRSRSRFQAGAGGDGGKNQRHGARGDELVLDVPVGTVVLDEETGELIADFVQPGMRELVAHGGRGGWGNKRFVSSTNQAPKYAQTGHEGEEVAVRLELRLLADVGLIGLPNAGKSTLLSAISNAKPKIAAYPFTTLEPMLGVVDVDWDRFTVADLPGLIEGASEGYGLGFEFLKHIRRCRVLLHLVDSASPDPVTDFDLIEAELRAYDDRARTSRPNFEEVPRLIAVTKADIVPEIAAENAATLARHTGRNVHVISVEREEVEGEETAGAGQGLDALLRELLAMVEAEKARIAEQEGLIEIVLRPEPVDRFTVTPLDGRRFRVEGHRPVQFAEMMNTGDEASRFEIYRRMERWGISKALARAGCMPGDAVILGEVELTWGE